LLCLPSFLHFRLWSLWPFHRSKAFRMIMIRTFLFFHRLRLWSWQRFHPHFQNQLTTRWRHRSRRLPH
jgi:hypothetical protein